MNSLKGKNAAGGSLRDMPIASDLMGAPEWTYSQWMQKTFDKNYSQENAADVAPGYNEGNHSYWLEVTDWARGHPEILQQTMTMYLNDQRSPIFELFPIKVTRKQKVISSSISIELDIPGVSTRKVGGRNIWAKRAHREEHTLYRIQGFIKDMTHMQTEDGQREWDMFVSQLASNLWSAVILDAFMEFQMVPCDYYLPEHQYSFQGMPTTPAEVFARDRAMWGIYNRVPQAHADVNAMVQRIFDQKKQTLRRWLMTREDLYRIGLQDETNRYAPGSGAAVAQRTRREGTMVSSILGNQIIAVPLLGGTQHNDEDEHILMSPTQVGSLAQFAAWGPDNDAANFRSRARDVRTVSATTDGFDTYRFCDFIAHTAEMVPERGNLAGTDAGTVNRDLLNDMAADATNQFDKTTCAKDGNERRLNVLLGYYHRSKSWYPLESFGEMDDVFCDGDEFPWVAETFANAMFRDFTEEDKRDFAEGLAFFRDLKHVAPAANMYGWTGMPTVNASADLYGRDAPGDEGGNLGVQMIKPNKWGFLPIAPGLDLAGGAAEMGGMGTISAALTLFDDIRSGSTHGMAPELVRLIKRFVALYETAIKNLKTCAPRHAAHHPRLVPLYHNTMEMNDFTRSMIVAWYFLFDVFTPPLFSRNVSNNSAQAVNPDDGAGVADRDVSPFLRFPEDTIQRFLGYFTPTPGVFNPAQAQIFAEKISVLVGANNALRKLSSSEAHQKKREKILDGLATHVPGFELRGGDDEDARRANGDAFLAFVGENATALEQFFEAICKGAPGDSFEQVWQGLRTVSLFEAPERRANGDAELPDGVIIQLVFSEEALRGAEGYGYPGLGIIPDHSNSYNQARYVVTGAEDFTENACGSAFDPEDAYSFASTLDTALAYVHPHYPLLPRSGAIGEALLDLGVSGVAVSTKVRGVRYRDGFPGSQGHFDADGQQAYKILENNMYTSRTAFEDAATAFPDLPRFIIQSIVAPMCGHPHHDDLTFFEHRWIKSHDLTLFHGIAQRALLMTSVDMKNIRGFDRCNIDIPLGGDWVRPFEEQMMHHQIALIGGPIGTAYLSGIDNTIGFRQIPQEFVVQAFIDHKAMIERTDGFWIAGNTRGGVFLGGKGRRYANEGIPVYPRSAAGADRLHEAFGNGAAMGDHSVFALLAGYNHARRPFKDQHFDLRGNWKTANFIGKLHESVEFVKLQPVPMYDAQFIFNFVYELLYDPPRKREELMSFRDKQQLLQNNYIVHQTTQRCNNREEPGVHPWGYHGPGMRAMHEGMAHTTYEALGHGKMIPA